MSRWDLSLPIGAQPSGGRHRETNASPQPGVWAEPRLSHSLAVTGQGRVNRPGALRVALGAETRRWPRSLLLLPSLGELEREAEEAQPGGRGEGGRTQG